MREGKEHAVAKGGLHVVLEDVAVAPGGRLSVRGWAWHESGRILGCALARSDGDTASYPALFGLERVHVHDRSGAVRFLKSSFYACGEMGAADTAYSLEFSLEDGSRVSLPVEAPLPAGKGFLRRALRPLRLLRLNPLKKAAVYLLRRDPRSLLRYVRLSRESMRLAGRAELLYLAEAAALFHAAEPKFPPLAERIDIVIPVYNNLEDARALIDSIRRNTDSPYRLILVDDCSSEAGVWEYLEGVAADTPGTVLLRNERNRGFVHSVNRAAREVENHFVIMNSDVEVPPHWLQRLMAPILEDGGVASTTPFTNAGTICSFPIINEDNRPFAGLAVEEVDRCFRLAKADRLVDLPSGVGFCMGVNLAAWKELGGFDEETFSPGYGEENDWCLRAYGRGYRNVAVPNLFVYHKHGGTFAPRSRNALLERHVAEVFRRYPHYNVMLDIFAKADPLRPYREFLVALLSCKHGEGGAALIVDHRLGGGARHYRDRLVEERLRAAQPVLVLTYDRGWGLYRLECLFGEYRASFCLRDLPELQALLGRVGLAEVFYNDMVSFPAPLETVRFLAEVAEGTGAELTVALHDYLPVCPSFNLIGADGAHCGRPDVETCRRCLPRNDYAAYVRYDVEDWRGAWGALLEKAGEVRCFSRSSLEILEHFYPRVSGKARLQPHELGEVRLRKPRLRYEGPLAVGAVGRLSYAKGSRLVVEMAVLMRERMPGARVVVIGELDDRPPLENLEVTGFYRREELPELLEAHGVNVCMLPSIWPETFSFVAEELMSMRVPLCCFDLGAPAERVREYGLGRVIREANAEAALDAAAALLRDMRERPRREAAAREG
ncbi:MAG: glycosyltransferase [Actinobacteria bacterium]|nr:glycosyltransferase [Actinomycetota bacterium]